MYTIGETPPSSLALLIFGSCKISEGTSVPRIFKHHSVEMYFFHSPLYYILISNDDRFLLLKFNLKKKSQAYVLYTIYIIHSKFLL